MKKRLFKDRITRTEYAGLIRELSNAIDGGPAAVSKLLFGEEAPDLYADHGTYQLGQHRRCEGLHSDRYEVPAFYYGAGIGEIDLIISDGSTRYAAEVKPYQGNDETLLRMAAEILTYTEGYPAGTYQRAITPFSVDHSACDSYMFLIEAEGKRILHTGDFRLHGFRGKAVPRVLEKLVGKVDVLLMEGTALSRPDARPTAERELQQRAREYIERYKYVFVLCASTNLERICALSKAVPRGRYFICDAYQSELLDLVQRHWGQYSPLYRGIKKTRYGENLLPAFREKGFLMMVRDNRRFREIIGGFDAEQSILLYAMWDGYRTRPGSTIPDFLKLTGRWEPLHTSGHASLKDLQTVIEKVCPKLVIPIHTEDPERLRSVCPGQKIVILNDGETIHIE